MSRIIRSAGRCYGCRTCQLVCSQHLTGSFWPERSAIRVSRTPRTGAVRWAIDKTCDLCDREEEPLCVKHCAYDALRIGTDEGQKEAERE
jgi:Fe-S-cluster-containing hydrogenase component 2